jgi:hypothetical protein
VVNDLNFGVQDIVFGAKMFNRHGTFDGIANTNMEHPSYAYLHCDLLDKVALTTITFKVKSSHINMLTICKKTCLGRLKISALSQSPKVTCMLSLQLYTPIISFELKLVPMFFHMDFTRKIKSSLQSWNLTTIIFIIISVREEAITKVKTDY